MTMTRFVIFMAISLCEETGKYRMLVELKAHCTANYPVPIGMMIWYDDLISAQTNLPDLTSHQL